MPHNNVSFVTDVLMTPDLQIGTCRQASVQVFNIYMLLGGVTVLVWTHSIEKDIGLDFRILEFRTLIGRNYQKKELILVE